jgi:hypothetical protein
MMILVLLRGKRAKCNEGETKRNLKSQENTGRFRVAVAGKKEALSRQGHDFTS